MTKTCVICKKCPVSGDNTRSFHKFPVNDEIKRQWMNITGVSKLTVNCTVCSDHFTPDSYYQTDGYTCIKRLLRNAVPNLIKTEAKTENVSEKSSNTKENEENKGIENSSQISVRTTLNSISEIEDCFNDYDDQNNSDTITHHDDEKTENGNEINMSTLKRKRSPIHFSSELTIKKMFRFRDGDETKYICRDEFVSEEAWEKFLTLMLINKRRMEALRQKITRTQRFFDCNPVAASVNEEDFGPEKFLEVILKE